MQSVRALKFITTDTKIFNYTIAITNIDLKNICNDIIRGKLNINKRIYVIFYLKNYYTGLLLYEATPYEKVRRKKNQIFSHDVSFSRKLCLKIYQVCLNMTNYRNRYE